MSQQARTSLFSILVKISAVSPFIHKKTGTVSVLSLSLVTSKQMSAVTKCRKMIKAAIQVLRLIFWLLCFIPCANIVMLNKSNNAVETISTKLTFKHTLTLE